MTVQKVESEGEEPDLVSRYEAVLSQMTQERHSKL
jgi:hypothetical protein